MAKKKIKKTKPQSGLPIDHVEYATQCVLTKFNRVKESGNGKVERVIDSQEIIGCRIFCSYSEKVVGVDVRVNDVMVSLNIEDVMEMMKAASELNREKFPREEKEDTL